VTTVKAAARAGFAAGDRVNMVFSACSFNAAGINVVLNGTAETTLDQDLVFNGASNFTSTIGAGSAATFGGGGNAQLQDGASGTTVGLTVPTGGRMTTTVGGAGVTYNPGVSFTFTEGVTNTGSLRVNGPLITSGGGFSLPITLTTPTTLTGPVDVISVVTPTAGELRITGAGPEASITAAATSVTVRGDSNGDGSLDLSFVTTWPQLLQ
jgi:hypothetical protein